MGAGAIVNAPLSDELVLRALMAAIAFHGMAVNPPLKGLGYRDLTRMSIEVANAQLAALRQNGADHAS